MVTTTLIAARGARHVERAALAQIQCPEPTRTYFPIPHSRVVETCLGTLDAAGYQIADEKYAVAQNGQQLFAVFTLASEVSPEVKLAVGLRTSVNRTLPLGLVAGSRVLVCSNLSFRADLINVRKKHTRFGEMRFNNAIASAVTSLRSFQDVEADRIRRMQETPIGNDGASLAFLTAMDRGIVSYTALPRLWKEWTNPSFDFGPPTLWRLFNAFTTVLGDRAKTRPNEYAGQTIRLNQLLLEDRRNGQEEN